MALENCCVIQATRFQSIFARVGQEQVSILFFPLVAARTKDRYCHRLLHTHTEQIHVLSGTENCGVAP